MQTFKTRLGLTIINPDNYNDSRGSFREAWSLKKYNNILGGDYSFVQDNISVSSKGVIRGLHFQAGPMAQGKLIQVIMGEILDVAVDIVANSTTFGHWECIKLNSYNQIFIPPGFAHGFQCLTEKCVISYKCTNYYSKEHERTIIWNDHDLNIKWDIKNPKISQKDKMGLKFSDL
jgi:dTDP-4-dehydrorhamnose 3,5-epimerase